MRLQFRLQFFSISLLIPSLGAVQDNIYIYPIREKPIRPSILNFHKLTRNSENLNGYQLYNTRNILLPHMKA